MTISTPDPDIFGVYLVDPFGVISDSAFGLMHPNRAEAERSASRPRKHPFKYHTQVVLSEREHAERLAAQLQNNQTMKTDADMQREEFQVWCTANKLIDIQTAFKQLGLTNEQFRLAIAVGLIRPRTFPGPISLEALPADVSVSIQELDALTNIGANKAAAMLGITKAQFEKLRKKAGIEVVSRFNFKMPNGIKTSANLYRYTDVKSLQGAADELKAKAAAKDGDK